MDFQLSQDEMYEVLLRFALIDCHPERFVFGYFDHFFFVTHCRMMFCLGFFLLGGCVKNIFVNTHRLCNDGKINGNYKN